MNLCIPVEADLGLDSPVCAHFGSAPYFLVVDVDTADCRVVPNGHAEHEHGHCRPLQTVANLEADALVVGGIGRGALSRLQSAGIPVYVAGHTTAAGNLELLRTGGLRTLGVDGACGGHGHGGGHGHAEGTGHGGGHGHGGGCH